ncbi:hypothetical protein A3C09_01525 [Candidatus Uhrbacteria bacterium RIFCSPHIGHO2_02_FULL_47_44]|uniref:DUF5658 domain-containing protein n=1 Tax=Candidatus Uhrbacteria bacterium RIFCSPLOWO2_02_FULL_48_18 TaxID=1802408 RepID=A0A1F7V8Z8_9BACT|nr:MAG: hypothetical protein A2839_02405 [Candidatus Uhrbacteria bacterium RIFCSPHIGHO2_01_FULL_47_10]OGL69845.1 MAG: hypothetical protein A3C09_01525 [Candidatus Uhrbacteria bacterium RIFCSPHIGHO2_02_FULL_47_44]OGL77465.1 MAG: hypothetical protein A3E97_00585 [Candidatus Uhrbacteria bacterium RIFCSPHIGHO2_12_FULL_47_12]OGL81826.1 MAG: hypothetical protein A3B20_01890 [Candidatus Uhrbacteria bacterium RIFCSPLOWO2_01_FULL_47_17]OGL86989.1 MAG: hypothetical protein A3I41_03480 [Candidatus Uhrbact
MSDIAKALEQVILFRRAEMILCILNLLDAGATLYWIQSGLATEANPIMNHALLHGVHTFAIAKIFLVVIAAGILWSHRHLLLSRIGVALTSVVYAGLAGIHIGGAILKTLG